jgi:hypothetical protein
VRVAALQPTYWARAHVWNRVLSADVFVWLDGVKFSRSAAKWEDRTVVESGDGRPVVLRLPLRGSRNALWAEAGLNRGWRRHEKTIRQCYSRRPHFSAIEPLLAEVYGPDATTIEQVCWRTFEQVAGILRPRCRVVRSSSLGLASRKGDLVLDLVLATGGSVYLTGAPGAAYLPRERFAASGVSLEVQDWAAPRTDDGLANPSILHLLACHGPLGTLAALADPPSRR